MTCGGGRLPYHDAHDFRPGPTRKTARRFLHARGSIQPPVGIMIPQHIGTPLHGRRRGAFTPQMRRLGGGPRMFMRPPMPGQRRGIVTARLTTGTSRQAEGPIRESCIAERSPRDAPDPKASKVSCSC